MLSPQQKHLNKNLVRFIHEDYNGNTYIKDHVCSPYNVSLSIKSESQPIISVGMSYQYIFPKPTCHGELELLNITDLSLMPFILEQYRIFKIKVFLDIFSFDPDDVEMAINVRSVHKSPYPDYELSNAFVQNHKFSTQKDYYNDLEIPLINSINFSFSSLTDY